MVAVMLQIYVVMLPEIVGFGVDVQPFTPAVPLTEKVLVPVGAIPPVPAIVSVNTNVDPIPVPIPDPVSTILPVSAIWFTVTVTGAVTDKAE